MSWQLWPFGTVLGFSFLLLFCEGILCSLRFLSCEITTNCATSCGIAKSEAIESCAVNAALRW